MIHSEIIIIEEMQVSENLDGVGTGTYISQWRLRLNTSQIFICSYQIKREDVRDNNIKEKSLKLNTSKRLKTILLG